MLACEPIGCFGERYIAITHRIHSGRHLSVFFSLITTNALTSIAKRAIISVLCITNVAVQRVIPEAVSLLATRHRLLATTVGQ